jgi:hypothetical protein
MAVLLGHQGIIKYSNFDDSITKALFKGELNYHISCIKIQPFYLIEKKPLIKHGAEKVRLKFFTIIPIKLLKN